MGNKAIIWDYDGTLVDTRAKNFNVTKRIMRHLLGVRSSEYPALQSLAQYIRATRNAKNWRELYRNEFAMNEDEISKAGSLWTEYQLSDDSESALFEGIDEVIRSLSGYPNLIFSQNSRSNIAQVLEEKDLMRCFVDIIGYEEVASSKQKPAPDGLLLCISRIEAPLCEHLFFIGDHEADTLCGHNANVELRKRKSKTRIINVAAFYGSENDTSRWKVKPDHIVSDPRAIPDCVERF
jgi:HAD superfamily hydrolase (TIGR01549 family)